MLPCGLLCQPGDTGPAGTDHRPGATQRHLGPGVLSTAKPVPCCSNPGTSLSRDIELPLSEMEDVSRSREEPSQTSHLCISLSTSTPLCLWAVLTAFSTLLLCSTEQACTRLWHTAL